MTDLIEASQAKYIKFGTGGEWQNLCIADGTARLGYYGVPHEFGLEGDSEGIKRLFLDRDFAKGTASSHARQVLDFYDTDADTLWITFANGHLYWSFLDPEVEFLGEDRDEFPNGSRLRGTQSGWSNKSINGKTLLESDLNGKLITVKGYRGTICDVKAIEYLLDKINDREAPQIITAHKARQEALSAIQNLISMLTWRDFELLVDLIFAQSGWRRISETGGTQETVDLELTLPSTGERGFVQVKSKTDQTQLDDYIARFGARSEDRMFYVYHTAKTDLKCSDQFISLIGKERLSEMILEAGLFDWLIEHAG